ncbi:MAG: hypothetical protein KDA41_10040, partial [Planctomycetales bacterium]|nr:hypothetical protein [Planctomycetales bacterium]
MKKFHILSAAALLFAAAALLSAGDCLAQQPQYPTLQQAGYPAQQFGYAAPQVGYPVQQVGYSAPMGGKGCQSHGCGICPNCHGPHAWLQGLGYCCPRCTAHHGYGAWGHRHAAHPFPIMPPPAYNPGPPTGAVTYPY